MTDIHMPSPVTIAMGLILIIGGVVGLGQWNERLRDRQRSAQMSCNLRQIAMALICYTSDDEKGRFPPSLPFLVVYTDGELVPKLFKDPRHPSIVEPILYVRPHPGITGVTPMLVADPACRDGQGSIVAFGDGHVEVVPGVAVWGEARRLATSSKAADGGIEAADWTTLPVR
jgi:prepilin-type processing-associated H-X9-DG protein